MGTKKGMVRKTARKAYMKKAGYGSKMKAKSGTKKGMVRKTARKAYMKKGGSVAAMKRKLISLDQK